MQVAIMRRIEAPDLLFHDLFFLPSFSINKCLLDRFASLSGWATPLPGFGRMSPIMQTSNSTTTTLSSLGWGKEGRWGLVGEVGMGVGARSSEFCKYEVLKFWGFVGHKWLMFPAHACDAHAKTKQNNLRINSIKTTAGKGLYTHLQSQEECRISPNYATWHRKNKKHSTRM